MKKWLPSLAIGLAALANELAPALQVLIAAHPKAAVATAAVAAWIAHLLPSPLPPKEGATK